MGLSKLMRKRVWVVLVAIQRLSVGWDLHDWLAVGLSDATEAGRQVIPSAWKEDSVGSRRETLIRSDETDSRYSLQTRSMEETVGRKG